MARRRYTTEQKASVVGMAVIHGTRQAAQRAGVPETTVRYWLDHPAFVELRTKSRDEVADRMWAAIQVGVDEIAKGLREEAPLRDKAVAVGVLYDKHALLTGMATSRTESRDISGTLADSELIAAIREADRLTGEDRATAPTADEAAG